MRIFRMIAKALNTQMVWRIQQKMVGWKVICVLIWCGERKRAAAADRQSMAAFLKTHWRRERGANFVWMVKRWDDFTHITKKKVCQKKEKNSSSDIKVEKSYHNLISAATTFIEQIEIDAYSFYSAIKAWWWGVKPTQEAFGQCPLMWCLTYTK